MTDKIHKHDRVTLVAIPVPVVDAVNALMSEAPELLGELSGALAKRSRDEVRPENECRVLRTLADLLHDICRRNERKAKGYRMGVLKQSANSPNRVKSLAAIVRRELQDNDGNVLDAGYECLNLLERLAAGETLSAADVSAWIRSARAQQKECAGENVRHVNLTGCPQINHGPGGTL